MGQQILAGCCFEVFAAGVVERGFDASLRSDLLKLDFVELGHGDGDSFPFHRAFNPRSDPRVVTLKVPRNIQVVNLTIRWNCVLGFVGNTATADFRR